MTRHCSLAIAMASIAGVAQAQNAESSPMLGEITVTAQRREESAQNVPISITTLDPALLSSSGADQLSDIAELTPGLRFDNNSAFVQPTIRGIGNSVVTAGGTSNVAIYVDNFYVPNPVAVDFQLLNMESIQVLKGPQGTLFGRNATGGAILVTSTRPSTETSGFAEASYGSYGAYHVGTYGTTGVTDNIAVDFEAKYESGDGYWDNIVTGNDDDAQYDNWSTRLGLAADISENTKMLLRYVHHRVDDGRPMAFNTGKVNGQFVAASFVPPSLMTAEHDKLSSQLPLGFTSETDAFQMTLEFDLGFATLMSYTQYREDNSRILQDNDGTGATVVQLEIGLADETFSQEFLMTSKDEGPLQWTAGLYYIDYEDTFFPVRYILPAFGYNDWTLAAGSTNTVRTYASYLDMTYQLMDRLYLTAGIRYSRDKNTNAEIWAGSMMPVDDDYANDQLTPRAVLRYEIDDSSSVYASFTQGHKAGFLDVANPAPAELIKPEKIDAFEIGYKYAGDRLGFDLAAYHYDYENLQVTSYPAGTAITVNAATATIKGLEGQIRYALTEELQLSAGAAWIGAEYDDFTNNFRMVEQPWGLYSPVAYDSSGQTMQRTPEFTGTLGARYTTALAGGTLALSGNLYYSSSFYFDSAEFVKEEDYTTIGLNAAWTSPSEKYTVSVYGNNITDEEFRAQAQSSFSGLATVWAPPATVGASLRVNF